MGLSDGAFFIIKHTPLLNGNHPHFEPYLPIGSSRYVEALWESLWKRTVWSLLYLLKNAYLDILAHLQILVISLYTLLVQVFRQPKQIPAPNLAFQALERVIGM